MGDLGNGRRLCLGCRTWLGDERVCDLDASHRVADLASPEGRAELRREVWSGGARRRALRLTVAVVVLAAFAAIAALAAVAGGHEDWSLGQRALAQLPLAAAVIGLMAFLGARLAMGRPLDVALPGTARPAPGGAPRLDLTNAKPGAVGVVEATGAPIEAPLSGAGCVAFGVEAVARRADGGPVTFRVGRTAGFRIRRTDGEPVLVPPGRARLVAAAPGTPFDEVALEDWLRGFEPAAEGEGPALLPADEATELVLREGDQVALLGAVELRHLGEGPGYRGGEVGLAPISVPLLEIVARKPREDSDIETRAVSLPGVRA